MTRAFWAILGLAAVLTGCGESDAVVAPTSTHGGTMVSLPDNKGYVEIVKRPAASPANSSQVVAYFYDPARAPMGSPPTAATLKLRSSGKGKPIDLKPGEGGSMETPPMPDPGEIEGNLTATIDGTPVTATLGGR